MPDRPRPPYNAGSVIIPKALNKWLDVNAQNGALRRVKTFLTLPAISLTKAWAGYRQIAASVNFEAPNNFSLKLVGTAPNASSALTATTPSYFNVILDVNGNPLLDVNGNQIYGI